MTGGQPEQSNSGEKGSISWAFFDKQINKYRANKVSQSPNLLQRLMQVVLSVPRFVMNWLRVYEPRWRTIVAMILLVAILSTFYFASSSLTQAATYTFVQSSWAGGVSGSNATHPGNQTGWTNFSAQTNASTSSGVSASTYSNDFSETFTATTYRDNANTTSGSATVAIDASTPARAGGISQDSVTTANFSPPGSSLLIATVSTDSQDQSTNVTFSITDNQTPDLTWVAIAERDAAESGTGGSVAAWYALVSNSITNLNVTIATTNVPASDDLGVKVYVVTGHDSADPIGAQNEGSSATNNLTTTSLTPETSGMLFAVGADWNGLGTPVSSDLTEDGFDWGNISGVSGYKSVTASSSTTANLDAGSTGAAAWNWIQFEVRVGSSSTWNTSGQLSVPAGTGVTVADTSNSAEFPNETSARTLSHTVAADDNYLVVGVTLNSTTTANRTASTVTFNGDPMTKDKDQDDGARVSSEFWVLANPDVGTFNVSVTPVGSVTFTIFAMSLKNVASSSQIEATGGVSDDVTTPATVTVNGTSSGSLVIDLLIERGGSGYTADASQSNSLLVSNASNSYMMSTKPGSGDVTMSWSWTGTSNDAAHAAISVRSASSTANAQSIAVDSVSGNITAATLTKNDTVGTGSITYYLSNDGGSTFNQVTPTSQYTFSSTGSDLRFRVTLTGNATVQDLSINYIGYNDTADLTSSAYNSTDTANLISKLAWSASGTTGSRTVKFQVRSAPDSSGSPGSWSAWCGYDDCSGTNYFETADNDVSLAVDHPLRSGSNDQWLQYKIFITTDGGGTPTVSSVTVTYVVNATPQFDADYPTAASGGTSAAQDTDSNSGTFGKVLINYRIRDTDTSTGTSTPGFITPSFEYNIGGGWVAITSGNLGATDLNNKAVDSSSYTTYTATWNAQAQIPNNYLTTAQVRVTINDNEAANNTANDATANFTLDTRVPVVSTFTANSATDTLTLAASDDTNLQYRISNNSDLSADGVNATSGQWQAAGGNSISITPSWTFGGSPNELVYYQVRDTAGNTTSGSAKVPVTLTNMDIKDISNEDASHFREFVSWGVYSSVAGATFASYKVYRSTDGSSYTLVSTINDININYYADLSLSGSTTYYYKVAVVDTDGDTSNYSAVVSDQPNGQGGSDTTAPSITNVTVTATQSTYVTITWTTDELSDTRVDYSISPSTLFGSGQTNSSFVTSHSITLTGLTPNTTYLFRARSLDTLGNTGTNDNSGAGFSFTTSSGPVISNVTETLVNETSATIFWTTNTDSDSHVSYSTSSNLASPTTVGSDSLVGGSNPYQHVVNLTGLASGTTYYYQVTSEDGSNNTSINNNGGSYYSFRTTTDTVGPVISNISTPVLARSAAVIVWQTNELATTQVSWSAVSGNLTNTTVLDSTLSIFHVVSLSGLLEDTTYYYKVKSRDQAGNETVSDEGSFNTDQTTIVSSGGGGGGGSSSVVLDTTPPTINNVASTEVGTFSAKVTFDTSEDAIGVVMYGTDENALTLSSSAIDFGKNQIATLSGLRMGTDYFFKTKAFDKSGNITTTPDAQTFTTKFLSESTVTIENAEAYRQEIENAIESALPSLVPPFIENPRVTEVSDSTAKVTWRTNVATYSVVEYATDDEYRAGTDKPYAIEVSNTTDKTRDHEMILQNLNPNTRYHFRVKGFSIPRLVGMSNDLTFVTRALSIQAQIGSINNNSFRVTWRTNEPTSSVVEYRNTKTGVLNQKNIEEQATSHEITVDNLTPATTYEVSVYGFNSKGNKVQTANAVRITTSQDVAAPQILSLKIDTALIPGRNDRTQTIVSWKTNEPSTSTVYYEEGGGTGEEGKLLANKVEITNSYVLDHAVVISTLKPGGLYRIQVASTDNAGNVITLPVKTIVVPRQSESILDVVFKNFEETFKFLREIGK